LQDGPGVLTVVPGEDAGDRTRPSRPVTLEDVARMSGVSRATASRALNGHARVNAEVRARIELVAERLGYRPNTAARSLASGRAGVLGLVLPAGHLITAPYEAHLLEAIADAATASGQGLMLWMATTEPSKELREGFRAGLVDGVVVYGVALGTPWVEDLFDGPQPCVLVGRHPARTDIARIEMTNEASAAGAVDHLVAGGGRRVAVILGPSDRIDGRDRHVGYERALYRNGIEVDTRLVERGEFTIESGYEAMRRLLAHNPDSVFACNDMMAAGALDAIHEARLRVPEDIAVIGFDDLPIATRTTPALSTVRQDLAAIGAAAVDVLIRLVHCDDPPPPTVTAVDGSLVIRGTTRPVAGAGSDAANPNQEQVVREVVPSRTAVAVSTSSGENRRATS
jgi:LacI family transcriptional regulator